MPLDPAASVTRAELLEQKLDGSVMLQWMTTTIADNPAQSRYELDVDGTLAGLIAYRMHGQRISLVHTEIADDFEGQGLAGRLAAGVLEDVRRRGFEVIPLCPFVAAYIRKHPDEYLDLVSASFRDRVLQPEQES